MNSMSAVGSEDSSRIQKLLYMTVTSYETASRVTVTRKGRLFQWWDLKRANLYLTQKFSSPFDWPLIGDKVRGS